jgi:hypothetical protein
MFRIANSNAVLVLALLAATAGVAGGEPIAGGEAVAGKGGVAEDLAFRSGPGRVALMELYTSEGCSSCPPAEAWLSGLRADPGLWNEFVPVAYHVDIWDGLGWRDPFSSRTFTQRQVLVSASRGSFRVYTPCFVRDGLEWRPGEGIGSKRIDAGRLALERSASGKWRVEYTPPASENRVSSDREYFAHIAPLACDVQSDVRAGENRGRRLVHDFVALSLEEKPLVSATGALVAEFALRAGPPGEARPRAVAAWITRGGDLLPVQAVGGWLR